MKYFDSLIEGNAEKKSRLSQLKPKHDESDWKFVRVTERKTYHM